MEHIACYRGPSRLHQYKTYLEEIDVEKVFEEDGGEDEGEEVDCEEDEEGVDESLDSGRVRGQEVEVAVAHVTWGIAATKSVQY